MQDYAWVITFTRVKWRRWLPREMSRVHVKSATSSRWVGHNTYEYSTPMDRRIRFHKSVTDESTLPSLIVYHTYINQKKNFFYLNLILFVNVFFHINTLSRSSNCKYKIFTQPTTFYFSALLLVVDVKALKNWARDINGQL